MSVLDKVRPAWFLAAAAFFLPIKPAPVSFFLLLAFAWVLYRAQYRQELVNNFKSKALLPLWFLLGFLALTWFFPTNNPSIYEDFLSKYGRLLLIPVLACLLVRQSDQEVMGKGFLAGMALVLGLSYSIWLGADLSWLGIQANTMSANPDNPTVFKAHITHNFFLVVAIYFWVVAACKSPRSLSSVGYAVLAGLALVNLFGMIDGRTGWLVFMVLPLFWGYRKYGFKGLLLGALVVCGLVFAAYFFVGNVHDRISTGMQEMQQVLNSAPQQGTSIGERVMYLTSSWSAVLQAPLLGYGVGGIENAVEPFTTAAAWPTFRNPHNQFLMFALQGGVVAVLAYLLFYCSVLIRSSKTEWARNYILPILLLYFVGNLLNSFHFDFAESVGFVLLLSAYAGGHKGAHSGPSA